MSKTAKDAAGEAVSNTTGKAESTALATQNSASLQETNDGDVAGPLALALSTETQDRLMMEFAEAMHQVQAGFGNLTAPGEIAALDQSFRVVDAITIDDFEDRKTGEVKTKHIFKLEFDGGMVKLTMQSDARPRRVLADLFRKARLLGRAIAVGPYKYVKKTIPGQIQAAYIFEQQPGFDTEWR